MGEALCLKGLYRVSAGTIYLEFIKRWYWLIVLGVVAAIGATYLVLDDQEPLYRSTATVQVGRTIDQSSPTQDDLAIADRLVPAYGEIARRDLVLEEVIDALDLNTSADGLRSRLLVEAVPRTQLIDIHVLDSDPEVAAAVANEVARQVLLQSPDENIDSETQSFIRDQLADLQVRITDTQAEAGELENEIASMASATDIFDAQQRLSILNAQVETWQETYASLLTQLEPSNSNIVRVVGEAVPASSPVSTPTLMYYGLATVFGLGLSSLVSLGLHTFDRKVQRADDLQRLAGRVPIITIPRYKGEHSLVSQESPESDAASAYRVLRNMIETKSNPSAARTTLAITSSQTGEGKTTTTANLGIALANSGHFVILVDANVRNPELDERFGITAEYGFCDLLQNMPLNQCIQPTTNPNLWIVGAGGIPDNYTDLLATASLGATVDHLTWNADYVIFDTPALEQEHETQLLAKHLDGALVVAESHRVSRGEVEEALEVLELAGVQVHSMVLNKSRSAWWSQLSKYLSRDRRLEQRARARREARQKFLGDRRPVESSQSQSVAD